MELKELADKRISFANDILSRLSTINVVGVTKLRNKIKQEINFLEKCRCSSNIKEEHLNCSNLTHLEAVASQLVKHENSCTSVMSNKILKTGSDVKKICIDLILYDNSVWMKVIARNRKALTLVSNGDCAFGQKSIVHQGEEFIECSQQHIHYFNPPTVIFYFANGIEDCLAKELSNIGIVVKQAAEDMFYKEKPFLSEEPKDIKTISTDAETIKLNVETNIKKLNLGVTTLIAYVSALTNGRSHLRFLSDILNKHAEWERARPVKSILDKLFQGRELYCCQTAVDNFQTILNILGGKGERERGEELLKRLIIVEDHPTTKLKSGGKIKERSLAIFGTGEYLKAVTVTANHAFIRSAMNRGIYFQVFLHESRALTEGKELSSTMITMYIFCTMLL